MAQNKRFTKRTKKKIEIAILFLCGFALLVIPHNSSNYVKRVLLSILLIGFGIWETYSFLKYSKSSLEAMLKALSDCDINLAPGKLIEDVRRNFQNRGIEVNGYVDLLTALGGDLSHNIWHFDTEWQNMSQASKVRSLLRSPISTKWFAILNLKVTNRR